MFRFNHFNFNVFDLEKSLAFYKDALGLTPVRKIEEEGFLITFLSDGQSDFRLELTYLKDRTERYDIGEGEYHLAMSVHDMEQSKKKHEEMGVVCFVNAAMGIYFIEDPDGYWIEIIPEKR